MNLIRVTLGGFTLASVILIASASEGPPTDQSRLPLLMPDDFEVMHLVSWREELGAPDAHNPLLEPAMPWDSGGVMAHGTVLHDPIDGLWKAWQVSTPAEESFIGLAAQHENQRRLTYLESKDGINWYRPMLSLVRWPGHDRTNILLDLDSGGTAVYASVLVEPENKEWPYEMFVLRSPKLGGVPNRVGNLPGPKEKLGTYRYRSKDGKDWKLVAGPIDTAVGGGADVSFVYREPDGSYVSYYKSYTKLRDGDRIIPYDNNSRHALRGISRRTSPNGTDWGNDSLVLIRDWRDPDYTQFIELCPVKTNGGYVALATCYDASIQTMSLQMAASRDGIHWWRPDRRPVLPNVPLGDYGGGMTWQMHNPIVEQGTMYVYYAGSEGIHGEIHDSRLQPQIEVGNELVSGIPKPTLPFNTALCRAAWQFDRLWALVPSAGGPTIGEAVTRPQHPDNGRLEVNIRVKPGGAFRAELLDQAGQPIPGFAAADCQVLTGDHRRVAIAWKGGSQAPAQTTKIRFVLQRTFLYGYEWVAPPGAARLQN